MPRPTHARIDLEAVAHNVRQVKTRLGKDVRVLVAVKADAYGHGAVPVSETALAHGAQWLGVATVEEGIELRRAGIQAPVLCLGALAADDIGPLIKWRITPSLTSLDFARALDRQAGKGRKRVRVHVNVDTGMGRVGFQMSEVVQAAKEISSLGNLLVEGVSTHFPSSDEKDKAFTFGQIERFRQVIAELRKSEVYFPLVHTANSAAILDVPESWFNMVRLGISLYGYFPSEESARLPLDGLGALSERSESKRLDLRPAMSVHSRIIHLKSVPADTPISYGRTFVTERRTLVATVPVGYADGLARELSNRGKMIVKGAGAEGVVCPIIGRVCMDQTLLDVTEVPGVTAGSEVQVFSANREDPNSVESTARLLGTIPHVVTCAVSKRVPRIYLPAHPPKG